MSEESISCSKIPYLRFGEGEPLVFIHGLEEVKEGWNNQFEFADQYDLIIPDLRGHGEYITNEKISIPHFARDSEFVIIRNTGHIAKLEQKDSINRILRNFLKKHSKVS
ncbi:alpha/beta hydrolase [Neobacillus drentensis]|uniref:alpha/beta fold hydrolase n=1 Tax=Neobacillus drentensis TaxID=220684 RepID=UPI003002DEE6